jgi:virginiamycin B lyase
VKKTSPVSRLSSSRSVDASLPARVVLSIAIAVVALSACTERTTTSQSTTAPAQSSPAPPEDSPSAEPSGSRLVRSLRSGGHVIYFRHAATDPVPDDADPVDLRNCRTQRNLSVKGRRQSMIIGRGIGRLDIPIGRVLASPFCRSRETARLAFGRTTIAPGLENLETAEDEAERRQRIDTLMRLLSASPDEGTNTVLVAHGFNITDAADLTLAEGEAAVFEPRGSEGFKLVARVTPDKWTRLAARAGQSILRVREYDVPAGSHPHDVAPAPDGSVWYTAQGSGELGRLDPDTGRTQHIPLGEASAPHGVIVGPDGAPWITDGGLNAIVRVDPRTERVKTYPLPENAPFANLNTATFDDRGVLWFTGQAGVYGRLDPDAGAVETFTAPRGEGPYGITTTPSGEVYYASLAGSHIARIDTQTGRARVIEPPTEGQGARRIWSDSGGRLWISEWNAGRLGRYDPTTSRWREWRLPCDNPQPYAVFVDDDDFVWLTDFGSNALVRFDPDTERFRVIRLSGSPAEVRQLLGRPGEVWGAESGVDKLVVVRTS